jgi:hypothetical protein
MILINPKLISYSYNILVPNITKSKSGNYNILKMEKIVLSINNYIQIYFN